MPCLPKKTIRLSLNLKEMKVQKKFVLLFFFFTLINCESNEKIYNFDELSVRNFNDISHYFWNEKPATGIVIQKEDKNDVIVEYYVDNGVKNGYYKEYLNDNNLLVTSNYSAGILNGSYTSYFESGIVKEEKNYQDGFLEGKRQYNWPNGLPKEINEFKKGILTGHTYFYFSNGKLRKMAFFNTKGQKDSIWTEYHRGGILKDCIIYNKGKQLKRYQYDKAGNQTF